MLLSPYLAVQPSWLGGIFNLKYTSIACIVAPNLSGFLQRERMISVDVSKKILHKIEHKKVGKVFAVVFRSEDHLKGK